jgi:hypothetical protein
MGLGTYLDIELLIGCFTIPKNKKIKIKEIE